MTFLHFAIVQLCIVAATQPCRLEPRENLQLLDLQLSETETSLVKIVKPAKIEKESLVRSSSETCPDTFHPTYVRPA